jgi:hypothetical protein
MTEDDDIDMQRYVTGKREKKRGGLVLDELQEFSTPSEPRQGSLKFRLRYRI